MQPGAIVKPMVAMVCASCIVQDKAMGITYIHMVTTSVGQVALKSSHLAAQTPGLITEDVADLPKEETDNHLWVEGLSCHLAWEHP